MHKQQNYYTNVDVLNLLFDEWKFRLSQYWNITFKTVLINLIIIFIPFMKESWGVQGLNINALCFPLFSIFFAVCNYKISKTEMLKINNIKNSIKMYIKNHYPEFQSAYTFKDELPSKLHHSIPTLILGIQIILSIIMIIIVI